MNAFTPCLLTKVADRDGMVNSGMEGGWREGLEAMEKLLNS